MRIPYRPRQSVEDKDVSCRRRRRDPTGQRMLHDTRALTRQGIGWLGQAVDRAACWGNCETTWTRLRRLLVVPGTSNASQEKVE